MSDPKQRVLQVAMPKWQSHKHVWAAKIVRIEATNYNRGCRLWVDLNPNQTRVPLRADEPLPNVTMHAIDVSDEYMEKHKPQPGGYYICYEDGYESWSPAKAFESGYTLVKQP